MSVVLSFKMVSKYLYVHRLQYSLLCIQSWGKATRWFLRFRQFSWRYGWDDLFLVIVCWRLNWLVSWLEMWPVRWIECPIWVPGRHWLNYDWFGAFDLIQNLFFHRKCRATVRFVLIGKSETFSSWSSWRHVELKVEAEFEAVSGVDDVKWLRRETRGSIPFVYPAF